MTGPFFCITDEDENMAEPTVTVELLIGPLAGTRQEMPVHAATAAVSNGNARWPDGVNPFAPVPKVRDGQPVEVPEVPEAADGFGAPEITPEEAGVPDPVTLEADPEE